MTARSSLLAAFMLALTLPTAAQIREYHPMLTYIFFDSGSAVIPDRYKLYRSADEAASFNEADLPSHTLDIYHHLLNIIGSRMRRYGDTHIEIVGCNSKQPELGETIEVSTLRGEVVRTYLAEVWGIDTTRLRLLPPRDFPQLRSNPRDPLGIVENRRAEIRTDDWRLLQPVTTLDATPRPELADSTLDLYTLILFKFDSPEMGPINERIVREYIVEGLRKGAKVVVTGYSDVIGLDDRSTSLYVKRAGSVVNAIKAIARSDIIASLDGRGIGVADAADLPHFHDLPEGRFYNRGVQVLVTVPAE